jgi:diacylglycerol kinase family enzyme
MGFIIPVRAWTGTILKSRYVRHFRARTVHIHHPEMCGMQCDGDAHDCVDSMDFRVEPAAMKVITP